MDYDRCAQSHLKSEDILNLFLNGFVTLGPCHTVMWWFLETGSVAIALKSCVTAAPLHLPEVGGHMRCKNL